MLKNLKIISLFLLLIFPKSFALENKIILKINNEIITSLDILDEIKYKQQINDILNRLSILEK